jgi:hypothetical protein
LVLDSLLIGSPIQFGRRIGEEEAFFLREVSENSEFFVVIGRTSLKARNCFTATS